MAGFDLGSIIAEATGLQGSQTQQAQQQAGLNSQAQASSMEQAGLIKEAGNLQAQVQLVELNGKLQTQQANAKAAHAFGTDVNDVSNIIVGLGDKMRTEAQQLVAAQDRVSKIEANSDLFTNPGGWLVDLIQGDGARAERDALAASFDSTQKLAQNLNQATQQTVVTQNAISQTLSAASVKSTADATKALADAEALNAQIKGNQFGIAAIEALRSNGAQNFNRSLQVYGQITEDARYKEGMALRKEQFLALQSQRKAGKAADQYYLDATSRINAYNEKVGLPPVNESQVRATLNQPGKIGDTMRDREASGFQILETGSDAKLFGQTPSETISRLTRDTPTLPDSYAPAVSILKDSAQLAAANIKQASMDPVSGAGLLKDEKAKAGYYDQAVTEFAKKAQGNIQHGVSNPYEAPPIEVVLGEPNGLAKTNFGTKVLATLVATGQPNPTPDLLMATAAAALEKGDISFNEARDGIASFYENAVGIKNATGGFLQLGVPTQNGYKTKLSVFNRGAQGMAIDLASSLSGGLIGKAIDFSQADDIAAAKTLDLTKPTDVTMALTVMQSRKLSQDILNAAPR